MKTNNQKGNVRLKSPVKKSRKIDYQNNILNLQLSKLTTPVVADWTEEIELIQKNFRKNPEQLTDLIVEVVVNKMNLVGSEKVEITNFLRFYLDLNPNILDSKN